MVDLKAGTFFTGLRRQWSTVLLIFSVVFASAGALQLFTRKSPANRITTRPPIVCDAQYVDFGIVRPGEELGHKFLLRNHGSVPLPLAGIRKECGSCTVVEYESSPLESGIAREVNVRVLTGEARGPFKKRVWMSFGDFDSPIELTMVAKIEE